MISLAPPSPEYVYVDKEVPATLSQETQTEKSESEKQTNKPAKIAEKTSMLDSFLGSFRK
jgi:hypothetical protein